MFWWFYAAYSAIFALICAGIWRSKGGSYGAGFWLGFVLGVFGLAYVAFAVPSAREGAQRRLPSRPFVPAGETAVVIDDVSEKVSIGDSVKVLRLDGLYADVELPDGRSVRVPQSAFSKLEYGEKQPDASAEAETKECPRCAEAVKFRAKVCRFCGHEFELAKP